MAPYEESSEVYSRQLVEFCCKIRDLSNVIADGDEQALSNVRISERHTYTQPVDSDNNGT